MKIFIAIFVFYAIIGCRPDVGEEDKTDISGQANLTDDVFDCKSNSASISNDWKSLETSLSSVKEAARGAVNELQIEKNFIDPSYSFAKVVCSYSREADGGGKDYMLTLSFNKGLSSNSSKKAFFTLTINRSKDGISKVKHWTQEQAK